MQIKENEIHIFKSSLLRSEAEIGEFRKILSKDEIEIESKFKFDKLKRRYSAGRGTLRNLLSEYLNLKPDEIIFSYGDKGKPFIKESRIKFNLAHSNELAVYAFALDNEVGIDLEFKKEMPDAFEISERFFSKDEADVLKQLPPDEVSEGFLNCWTRKESFIKNIGEGLSYPLQDFSVTLKPGLEPEMLWIKKNPPEINDWSLINLNVDNNYISALAVKSKTMKLVNRF